jgi:hypothetical protein
MEFCNFMPEDPSSYTVGHSIKWGDTICII